MRQEPEKLIIDIEGRIGENGMVVLDVTPYTAGDTEVFDDLRIPGVEGVECEARRDRIVGVVFGLHARAACTTDRCGEEQEGFHVSERSVSCKTGTISNLVFSAAGFLCPGPIFRSLSRRGPLRIQLCPRFRLGNQPYPGEDAQGCDAFRKAEGVEPDGDGEQHRHQGLHVVVHRHDGRAQVTLPDRHHEIGEEGRADHHIADACPGAGCKRGVVYPCERPVVDRHGGDGGEEEHPFHRRHGGILDDHVAECREVGGIADSADDAQYVARHARRAARAVPADEDQQQRPAAAEQYAARLEPGDRLAQEQRRQHHGEYGDDGGDDRGVDGRGERKAPEEKHLVELDAEHRGEQQQHDVARGDFLPGQEERYRPEQQAGAQHTVYAQCERADSLRVRFRPEYAFTDRCVEAPDDIRDPKGRMPFQFSVHTFAGLTRQI